MEYIKVGTISALRGLKGELKIKALTNMQAERFLVGNELFIKENNQYIPLKISSYRVINGVDILTFENYEDINKVQNLRGFDLYMSDDYEINLSENEFFIDDLIGIKVYQNKTLKGIVKDIVTYPQGDYLVIETENGDKLIPFRDEFIETQNDEEISIVDMEGLL